LKKKDATLKDFEDRLATADSTSEASPSGLGSAQPEVEDLQKRLASSRELADYWEEMCKKSKAKVKEKDAALKEKDATLKDFEDRLSSAESTSEASPSGLGSAQPEVEDLQKTEVEDLQKQLASSRELADYWEEMCKKSKAKVKEKDSLLLCLERKLNDFEAASPSSNGTATTEADELQKHTQQQQSEGSTRELADHWEEQCKKSKSKVKALQQTLKEKDAAIQDLTSKLALADESTMWQQVADDVLDTQNSEALNTISLDAEPRMR
jgi:chromosome segregation ATPase